MIVIGFGTNEKWTSKLIRWVTRSEWSHVWIEYPSGVWGGRWVVHSWESGVVKVPLELIREKYPKHRSYDLNRGEMAQGFDWARERIGASYDYGVIWNALMLVMYRATGWEWLHRILLRNAAKFSCSEFVSGFMKASKVKGTEDWDPEFMPPVDLFQFCERELPVI
jgi:hypothetical protein